MDAANLIEVENLDMRYRVYRSRRHSLREAVFRTLLLRDERVDVWALQDVSFSVRRGEALGIIGKNGSGKSTLCLILSRILSPTRGRVDIAGRVSALLSLGAGFQTDLTGRENIYLQGAFMGHRIQDIDARFREIVEFSELGEFIDFPVRTYSSGMLARLAFSIAASIEPEILVVDELMGVGDLSFQEKSAARMNELIHKSQGLVVVSHNMDTIRSLCSKVIWLERGRLVAQGRAEDIIPRYEAS
ncbi:MAG: ABC transporter ATP-binding protein [Myxococcales bacterium]|nr:ABC transporter ATP-binding protein [Myxococcales bacterium]